ncbi:MAG: hypothetical protein K6T16_02085 [Candidatus Pacearchaeota archaeon]|nr:hypothetical protein [Candidatus Pacearchaeota archaeon]
MNTITIAVVLFIALLGYPVGLIVARMTAEELGQGRKWFALIIIACIIGIVFSVILSRGDVLLFLVASFVFIALLSLASLVKGMPKRLKIKIKLGRRKRK